MPKKKHRRAPRRSDARRSTSPAEQTRRRERDLQALLAQFALWRRESILAEQADEEASHVEPLLRLKAEQLDSVDPTYWTEELIEVLLTQVVPRKVIQPREMAMAQAPALGQFFSFLESRGRWHRDGLAVDQAREVLAELEFTVLEAADDPTARSFSGNLLTYASVLGVSPEVPEQFDAFVQWYNTALTDVERHEISDTGRLADPSVPFDPATWSVGAAGAAGAATGSSAFFPAAPGQGTPRDAADDGVEDAPPWPWFLPAPSAMEDSLRALDEVEDDAGPLIAAHAEVPLVQRAVDLLEFVGSGRSVTSTGALKLVDVRSLVEQWGLDLGAEKLSSMWQVDQIAGPWTALIAGGWLTITSTRVRRGEKAITPYAPAAEDPETFLAFARAVMMCLLISIAGEGPREGGFRGGEDTMAALLFAGGPDGLVLPEPFSNLEAFTQPSPSPSPSSGPGPSSAESRQLMRVVIDLSRLARVGLLRREPEPTGGGYHFRGNLAVLSAFISVVDTLRDGPR